MLKRLLNFFSYKNYERVVLKKGKDIGLRENNRGAIYINPKIYFQNSKVKELMEKFKNYDRRTNE